MEVSDTQTLREGVGQFNRGYYFEAHDLFEEVWMGQRGADREFLQGLIHVAVGLYHLNGWNLDGARSQLEKGTATLQGLPAEYEGLDVGGLLDGVRECL